MKILKFTNRASSLPSVNTSLAEQPLSLVVTLLLVLGSVIIWSASLSQIDLRAMNDLGLVSVMPPAMFAALVLLTISFGVNLRQPNEWVLALHMLVLIYMLYGVTILVGEEPRFATTWITAGLSEHIMRTGDTAVLLDARFSWPGFYALAGLFTQAAGFENPIELANWFPLFINLLYFGMLLVIYPALTTDKRLVWAAIWLFFLGNWIGQDYFSSQAMNFFFYLVIVGILLRWFKSSAGPGRPLSERRWVPRLLASPTNQVTALASGQLKRVAALFREPIEPTNAPSTPIQRAALMLMIVLLLFVIASSHPLTPFFVLMASIFLVIPRRTLLSGLPVLVGAIIFTWIAYMTSAYLQGHLQSIIDSVNLTNSINDNVGARIQQGSREHIFVVRVRSVMTLVLWGLAALGIANRIYKGRWDMTAALLMAAPFPILALQSYGGEAILRIYFFALPFAAFLAASLLFSIQLDRIPWRTTINLVSLSLILLTGFMFARYGNERMEYMTHDEVGAVEYLYDVAEPPSLFISSTWSTPLAYRDVELHTWRTYLDDYKGEDIDGIIKLMHDPYYNDTYLIVTRAQEALGELFQGLPVGWQDEFEQEMLSRANFKKIFENRDATVYVWMRDGEEIEQ